MMTTNNYGVSRADTSRSEHQVNVSSVLHTPFNHLRRIGVNAANNGSASAAEEEPLHQRIEKLKALGLTRRQAEVAFWIAQGKTNLRVPSQCENLTEKPHNISNNNKQSTRQL